MLYHLTTGNGRVEWDLNPRYYQNNIPVFKTGGDDRFPIQNKVHKNKNILLIMIPALAKYRYSFAQNKL